MRGLSWIIWVDHKCHQKCSYARKAEEFDAHRREGVSVTMEMKTTRVMWPQTRRQAISRCWKKQGIDYSLQLLERAQPS